MEVDYVYALHDFEPQNDDEIAFVAGERIEVLERDDAYGDGWWTGRNLAGQEGIFPKDYTTPAGPLLPDLQTPTNQASFNTGPSQSNYNPNQAGYNPIHPTGSGFHGSGYGSILHPLTEENESDSAQPMIQNGTGQNHAQGQGQPNGAGNNHVGNNPGGNAGQIGGIGRGGGQVMAATMTDIQHAIDQLGVRRMGTDDGRSISFVSTRDDRTSIEDHERRYDGYNDDQRSVRDSMYDDEMDNNGGRENGAAPGGRNRDRDRTTMNEELHRDARRRLFEKIDQMETERRAQEEDHRPPVDVEFSDESEDEDGHHHHHHHGQPPNDLLVRMQQHSPQHSFRQQSQNQLHHDDSIPSTLPSTFKDRSTTSLHRQESLHRQDSVGGDADTSNNTAGRMTLTDSPAKADSPTLAAHPYQDHQELSPPTDARSITPVQQPKQDAKPVEPVIHEPVKETSQDQYLPAPVHSPFAPSPFSVSTASAPPSAMGNLSYPISSSNIYPPPKSENDLEKEREMQLQKEKETKSTVPNPSSSYISFLPSPTATTFATAPSAGSGISAVPSSGGISQILAQSQSQPLQQPQLQPQSSQVHLNQSQSFPNQYRSNSTGQPQFNITQASSGSDLSKEASASTTNLSTTVPSIQGPDSSLHSPNGHTSIISSITSSSLAPPPAPTTTSPPGKKKTPPSEWTVDQVVDWVRSKGFDEPTCGKFKEHEITGDVLLEFDANMLKEIDIIAFGKRVRIANAISELRRPPSFESSDAASLNPQSLSQFSMMGQSTVSSAPQSGSIGGQFSPQTAFPQAAPGFPLPQHHSPATGMQTSVSMPTYSGFISPGPQAGMGHGHSISQSTQGGYNASISSAAPSMNSPNIFGVLQSQQQQQPTPFPQANQSPNQIGNSGPYTMISPGGGMYTGDIPSSANEQRAIGHIRVDSDPGIKAVTEAGRMAGVVAGFDRAATVGYGAKGKNRPVSLALSPSESNLGQRNINVPIVREEEDDRSALSESDLRKRKKEVLSLDSGITHEPPDTPGSRSDTPSRASARHRSSFDTKTSDRLSFFSRSRKPAPRYSSDQSGSEIGSPNITQAEKQKTYSKLYLAGPTRPPRVGKTKEEKEKEKKEKLEREESKRRAKEEKKDYHPKDLTLGTGGGVLRKNTLQGDRKPSNPSTPGTPGTPGDGTRTPGAVTLRPNEDVLKQLREIVGEADHSGFMQKKGERYNTWKNRFFFLKGPHLYYLRSKHETRIKGYINIRGYKVIADEATHPGRYGFRIVHDSQKPHFFSSEDQSTIREWMKALMKATIDRDYARPVVSSCNIPTIPLTVAQAMNPAPRPPSPTAIAAAQRASRQGEGSGLSSRDAKVLMGIADGSAILGSMPQPPAPARPSREMRRPSQANRSEGPKGGSNAQLLQWVNSLLPDQTPYATDLSRSLSSGLILFRLAESIKYGQTIASDRHRNPSPDDPVVPDKLFEGSEDRIDGLMKLFDFLLDNDVKLTGISMADIKEGRAEKIAALLRSMRQWKDERDAIAKSVGVGGQAGVLTWIHG